MMLYLRHRFEDNPNRASPAYGNAKIAISAQSSAHYCTFHSHRRDQKSRRGQETRRGQASRTRQTGPTCPKGPTGLKSPFHPARKKRMAARLASRTTILFGYLRYIVSL